MARKPLTPQQREAAVYVALGHTDQEIADTLAAAGTPVAKSTVASWRKRPDFQREVNKCVGEAQRMILRRGVSHGAAADEYLRSVMDSDDPRISTPQKIDAAKALQKRLPAITPDNVTEPVPDVSALPARPLGPDGNPAAIKAPEETLLEIYREMAKIEEARSRRTVVAVDYGDDEQDDAQDDDEPRMIVGELAEDDDRSVTKSDPESGREIVGRPKLVTKQMTERDLQRMARKRTFGEMRLRT